MAPRTAMITTAAMAKLRIAKALWPKTPKMASPNQPFRGFGCSTESTTTLRGHAAARLAAPQLNPRDLEEVVQLAVGQLRHQSGEEGAAGFADFRMIQRAGA